MKIEKTKQLYRAAVDRVRLWLRGIPGFMEINDRFPAGPSNVIYYDPTNPEARKFVWEQVRKSYHDLGIRVLWLDADEPEIYPMHHDNLRYALGNGMEVSSIYPLMHQQGFYFFAGFSVTVVFIDSKHQWRNFHKVGPGAANQR